jgi:hypothetical protein
MKHEQTRYGVSMHARFNSSLFREDGGIVEVGATLCQAHIVLGMLASLSAFQGYI